MSTKEHVLHGIKYKASIQTLIILLIGTFTFLSIIFYRNIKTFHATDKIPTIISMTPKKIIDFGGSPSEVTVGMQLINFTIFDLAKNIMIADLILWFEFDPKIISLEDIKKFSFDYATILQISEPYTKLEDKKLIARYNTRIAFKPKLHYKNFPLEDHHVYISLTHYGLSPSEITFESSKSYVDFSSEIAITGWQLINQDVKTGYVSYNLNKYDKKENTYYPRIVFTFDFARKGIRHIIYIFIPMILILFIALMTFAFNPFGPYANKIIPMSIAGATASVSYNFVISKMAPKVGYFMISDYMYLFVLPTCIFIFITNFFSHKLLGVYKNIIAITIVFLMDFLLFWIVSPLI